MVSVAFTQRRGGGRNFSLPPSLSAIRRDKFRSLGQRQSDQKPVYAGRRADRKSSGAHTASIVAAFRARRSRPSGSGLGARGNVLRATMALA